MTAPPPAARATHRLDLTIRIIVAVTVAVLALVAGAISFDHMYLLALAHHQAGWRAGAFPISVDGLEIVASLVILAEHRDHGKATSILPWTALTIGTSASLTANIAIGAPHDPIGRAISGWPAVALLVTLKLAAGRLTGPIRPAGPVRPTRSVIDLDGSDRSADDPDRPSPGPRPSENPDPWTGPRTTVPPDRSRTDPNEMISHARRVRDHLHSEGHRLTRRALAERLRADGLTVSNDRVEALVRALAAETTHPRTVTIGSVSMPDRSKPTDNTLPGQRELPAKAA